MRWRPAGPLGNSQPAGAGGAIPGAQDFEQAGRQHGVSVALSFALLDAQQHALGIDVGDPQGNHFGDPQAGAVGHHQGGAVAQVVDMLEETRDFLGTEDGRQPVRHFGTQQTGGVERRFQGDVIQEFGGGNELIEAVGAVQAVVEPDTLGTGADPPG